MLQSWLFHDQKPLTVSKARRMLRTGIGVRGGGGPLATVYACYGNFMIFRVDSLMLKEKEPWVLLSGDAFFLTKHVKEKLNLQDTLRDAAPEEQSRPNTCGKCERIQLKSLQSTKNQRQRKTFKKDEVPVKDSLSMCNLLHCRHYKTLPLFRIVTQPFFTRG